MDFSDICVLCVGDLMLDRFVYGEVERISPEAPVPVLRLNRTREMPGGVGNVASNIASLGGRAVLVGLVGADEAGGRLRTLLSAAKGIEDGAVETRHRPTVCKTRFIAGHQQVVRADEESRAPLDPEERDALLRAAQRGLPRARALVLADYGKGVLDEEMTRLLIAEAGAAGVPVFVDPKSADFSRYRGAACITPNLQELRLASGMAVEDEAAVAAAARRLIDQAGVGAVLATRSQKGMMLVERSGAVHSVAARAREVFDVSGAGDTVVAAMALCHAAGQPLAEAIHVANAAAGVVVSKLGTATADIAEVLAELEAGEAEERSADRGAHPLLSLAEVEARVAGWRRRGLLVGFANGCFDILHPGHVSLVRQARAACDRLVVALNTDASVRALKGPSRPVNDLQSRAAVMAALRDVDAVTAFDAPTPLALIEALAPDVLVKGADYRLEEVVGADLVRARGGRVVLATLSPGRSTTATLGRIRSGDVQGG